MTAKGWTVTNVGRLTTGRWSKEKAETAWFSTRHALPDWPGLQALIVLGGAAAIYLDTGSVIAAALGGVAALAFVVLAVFVANQMSGGDVWVLRASNGHESGRAIVYVSMANQRGQRQVSNVRAEPKGVGLGLDLMLQVTQTATQDQDTLKLDCREGLCGFYGRVGFTRASRPRDMLTPLFAGWNVGAKVVDQLPGRWHIEKKAHMIRQPAQR